MGRGDKGIDGSVRRMRPGGDGRMRHARSNGRVVEIGGLTATSTHAAREGGVPIVLSRGIRPFDGRFWQC